MAVTRGPQSFGEDIANATDWRHIGVDEEPNLNLALFKQHSLLDRKNGIRKCPHLNYHLSSLVAVSISV